MRANSTAVILAILSFSIGNRAVQAQNNTPSTYADPHNPAGSSGPAKDTQVWHVDPISGYLSINIPMLNLAPAGRGPWVPYSLTYNSAATVSLSSNIIPPYGSYDPDPGHQAFQWLGPNVGTGIPPGPWLESGRRVSWSGSNIPTTSNGDEGCTIFGPYILQDENGSHDLGLVSINPPTGATAGACAGPAFASSSTWDGSTIASAQASAAMAVYPDGTQCIVSGSVLYLSYNATYPCFLEDANGNQIPYPSSGTTYDSLGRSLYTVTYPQVNGQPSDIPTQVTTYSSNGSPENYTLQWGTASFNYSMPEPTSSDVFSNNGNYPAIVLAGAQGTVNALQSIAMPDSTSYQFSYDPTYGTVSKITFPTGGYVRFVYGVRQIGTFNSYTSNGMSTTVVTDVYLSTSNGVEDHWAYSYQNLNMTSYQLSSSVTDPENNVTYYTGYPYSYTTGAFYMNAEPTFQEIHRQICNGTTPVRTVDTVYNGQNTVILSPSSAFPATVTTTYNDVGLQQQVKYTYDKYSNVIEKDESNFYACSSGTCTPPSWLRKTLSTFYWAQSAAYQTAHIVDKPYTITVTDGSGNPIAETQYGYDEFALSGSAGYTNHDDQNYSATMQGPRGNVTSDSQCANFSAGACSSWLTTHHYYDLTGQVVKTTDPIGNPTTYDYTDHYVGGTPAQPTNGYITTVTRPQTAVPHVDTFTYYLYSGDKASHMDENSQTTTYSYIDPISGVPDPFNRLRQVTLPQTVDGTTNTAASGWMRYIYTDTPGAFSVSSQELMNASGSVLQKVENFDGLGRLITTVNSDPDGNTEVDQTYDADGRLYSVSNPYRSTSDSTYGKTFYSYDALNRPTTVQNPDNSAKQWCYDGVKTANQSNCHSSLSTGTGVWVDVADENGNDWQQTTDGLGRLVAVMEPNGTVTASAPPADETDYQYDVLGNLKEVDQWGGSHGSAGDRQRLFNYDGLSRLTYASNPETGPVTYSYLTNAALCAGEASLPCSKTDARSVTTQYVYDALNRLTEKSYTGITNPSESFTYDVSSLAGATNIIGKLTSETVVSGTTVISQRSPYAYDAMGRVNQMSECTGYAPATCSGANYQLAYGYDLAGHVTESTNGIPNAPFTGNPATPSSNYGSPGASFNSIQAPSVLLTTNYDTAGRPSLQSSSWSDSLNHPAMLFQANSTSSAAPSYSPAGQLQNAVLGLNTQSSQITATLVRAYDDRLRVASETDTGTAGSTSSGSGSSGSITITGTEQSTSSGGTQASGSITISGTNAHELCIEAAGVKTESAQPDSMLPPPKCQMIYDSGNVAVSVNGFIATATFGPNVTTSSSSLASVLATALSATGSPVTASASGSVITITSIATGTGADYSLECGASNGDYTFSSSCTAPLSGGANGTATWDTGTVSETGTPGGGSYTWGSSDTATTVANGLGAKISLSSNSAISYTVSTVNPNQAVLSLSSNSPGTSTNWPLACSAIDTAGQTASFSISGCTGMSGGSGSSGGTILYSYAIPASGGYASNSNLLSVADSVTGSWSYQYDNLNRLVQANAGAGTYAGTNIAGASLGWSYDAFGNRLVQSSNTGVFPSGSVQFGGTNNQATGVGVASAPNTSTASLGYDASGDVKYDGSRYYQYDAEGRICLVQNITGGYTQYIYDAEGNRVAKGSVTNQGPVTNLSCDSTSNGFSPTNSYVIGLGGEQVTEFALQGSTWAWSHSNVFGSGGLLATYTGSDTYFAFKDWLGTKRVELTPDGLTSSFASLPFGDGLQPSGNAVDATEHHFTGKERDAESGLDYFGSRYYGSNMGRFMSPDWSEEPDPVPYADVENPQTLNLYGYVTNNPLRLYDPTGHSGCCDVLPSMAEVDAGIAYLGAAAATGAEWTVSTLAAPAVAVGGMLFYTKSLGDPAEDRYIQMMGKGGRQNYRESGADWSNLSHDELQAIIDDPRTSAADRKKAIRLQKTATKTRNAGKRGGMKPKGFVPGSQKGARPNPNPAPMPMPTPDPPAPDPPKPPKDDHGDHP